MRCNKAKCSQSHVNVSRQFFYGGSLFFLLNSSFCVTHKFTTADNDAHQRPKFHYNASLIFSASWSIFLIYLVAIVLMFLVWIHYSNHMIKCRCTLLPIETKNKNILQALTPSLHLLFLALFGLTPLQLLSVQNFVQSVAAFVNANMNVRHKVQANANDN